MSRPKPSADQLRESMRQSANRWRDGADEMSAMFDGCDDPLHPFMPVGDVQPFRDWRDFYERVCVPLVESEDEATIQEAMRLYRKAAPHFIALAVFFAARSFPLEETP